MRGNWRESLFNVRGVCVAAMVLSSVALRAEKNEDRWWPRQALPRAFVRVSNPPSAPPTNAALQMMVQSLAGLAAKAVNEGRSHELVWVDTGNPNLEEWLGRWREAQTQVKDEGSLRPWQLVKRYTDQGIVNGYILFRLDRSGGELNAHREGMDCSVNIATSMAGLLNGVIVAEELEEEAKAHGLRLLLDARDKTQGWCFRTYRDRFNRRMLCTQDPRKPHVRDLAIAQQAFTLYGGGEWIQTPLEWLQPLSPILGWNGGDEFATTDLSSRYGHIQTATDWCMNLPVLMAGAEIINSPELRSLDPKTIDWKDRRSAVSFILTDGDNVQRFQGNFFLGNSSYWADADRGKIPFGWSCCFTHLIQLCPEAIDYAARTGSSNDFFVEWGGGYYYPDHFGRSRSNRWELLAQHAGRTWALMKRSNSRIIGFNVGQVDSLEARRAYEVIASQTDGLLAILVFQYAPYEAGAGQTFWVKDRRGRDVPVISACYSIWEHANARPRAGTPAKIAREIRQTVEKSRSEDRPRYDWVIVHAWSYFRKAPGADEDAEDLAQVDAVDRGGVRGYRPVSWCADRLPSDIRVIGPEELIWRLRMEHNAAETKQLIRELPF
ncbi:MAG: GxGYxYP family putative glycoside hydrolase [Verrucomicrobiota bacterium]